MKALLTIEEASELTKLSIKTLYKYAERETIPHIKLGRRVLFDEDAIEGWVNSYRVAPVSEAATKPTAAVEAKEEALQEAGEPV